MMKLGLVLQLAAYAYGCGMPTYEPVVSRVVNGEDAKPYSWPWQISLQYLSDSNYYHTCGGTLIAKNWVLTAGHCISDHRTYRVVLGEYDLTQMDENEQIKEVETIVVHPGWNDNCLSCGDDVALIKLASPATLNDKVHTSCLPPSGDILTHNYHCYISGWGRIYTAGPLAKKLQQALLPVVAHETCSQSDWWGGSVKPSMICGGGDRKAGCNGDSGGPLNCKGADGKWYVHGIASFVSSRGCNTLKKPTVFTRTSSFSDWITNTIAVY
ncbi:proproteinase E-like [Coregonus clupeaformis]|uniref:proproteinase E-like n=1 Tax=Coregonus clupeaformis TaxID=59861 RepID=UPI001BDF8664|nr:proproteinase E-like [Coregonus clupeaformis]